MLKSLKVEGTMQVNYSSDLAPTVAIFIGATYTFFSPDLCIFFLLVTFFFHVRSSLYKSFIFLNKTIKFCFVSILYCVLGYIFMCIYGCDREGQEWIF